MKPWPASGSLRTRLPLAAKIALVTAANSGGVPPSVTRTVTSPLPLFGATGENVEFDYDSPVPDDEEAAAKILNERVDAFSKLLAAGVDPVDAAMVACLPEMTMLEPEPVPPQLVPAAPGDPAEPADPGLEDDVAARARQLLASGGLARAILNGHSFTSGGRR